MKREEGTRKLCRSGHRVLQWFLTVFFLALTALTVEKMGIHGPNGAPVGLTAIFATIFVVQRILRSRVILCPHDMRVVNAIFEYRVACGAVKKVFVDNRGNLKIGTRVPPSTATTLPTPVPLGARPPSGIRKPGTAHESSAKVG